MSSIGPDPTIINIQPANGSLPIVVKIGDGPITVESGYGGWEEITRQKNKPLTRWNSQPALRMNVPIVLDESFFAGPEAVQDRVDRIYNLGRREDGTEEPLVFRMTGPAVPHSNKRFVMPSAPQMDRSIRDQEGRLTQQWMTITAMEFVDSDQLRFRLLPKPKFRRVRAKQGDTVNKIAARLFKGRGKKVIAQKAKEIARLNKIRDRNKKLTKGRVVKVPRS